MAYDTECYGLADYFIQQTSGSYQHKLRLAQRLQDCVDDFLEDLDTEREAAKDEADDRRGKERDEWRHEAAEAKRLK